MLSRAIAVHDFTERSYKDRSRPVTTGAAVHVERPIGKRGDGFEIGRNGKRGAEVVVEQHVVRAGRNPQQLRLSYYREPNARWHRNQARGVLGREERVAPA